MPLNEFDDLWVEEMFRKDLTVDQVLVAIPKASRSAVYRMLANWRTFGKVRRPKEVRGRRGPARIITDEMEEYLVDLLSEKPDLWQEELVFEVFVKFEVLVSRLTIAKALKRIAHTKKVATRIAGQRDAILRARYEAEMRQYSEEQLLFVDESNVSEKTMFRRTAWSPIGLPAFITSNLRSSTRCSVLPAYSIDGYLPGATLAIEGSITQAIFEDWLEHRVLPACEPFPGRCSVLVMDNCASHHGNRTRELCEARGVRLLYLPPYSPDYNPIELTFHLMKQWLRRHRDLAPTWGCEDYDSLWLAHLRGASDAWQDGIQHRELFRKARVRVR